jgi:type II secretory ATPase GspE/PulE/Tfp pilus assembly ATPase PilB-like protein
MNQVSGIILVTGPTGSGKSTTLYAGIREINKVDINIVTVEDPVEVHVGKYVNQSSLMPQAGYTYPKALRSILRQDPDVILIGEIRDLDSAEIAVQAALTGHLVLSTLHTEDAASAIVRLVDLGIEEYLVSSTVTASLNQRLLRKVCNICAEPYTPNEDDLNQPTIDKALGADIMGNLSKYTFMKGRGCPACRQTGYHGRQGVYEMLVVTPVIKEMILTKQSADAIVNKARELYRINMLFEEGVRAVLSGITTFEELRKIPRGDYEMKSVAQIFTDADAAD